jgi:hypothetical protein
VWLYVCLVGYSQPCILDVRKYQPALNNLCFEVPSIIIQTSLAWNVVGLSVLLRGAMHVILGALLLRHITYIYIYIACAVELYILVQVFSVARSNDFFNCCMCRDQVLYMEIIETNSLETLWLSYFLFVCLTCSCYYCLLSFVLVYVELWLFSIEVIYRRFDKDQWNNEIQICVLTLVWIRYAECESAATVLI